MRCKDLPDSDQGNFRWRRVVDSSSYRYYYLCLFLCCIGHVGKSRQMHWGFIESKDYKLFITPIGISRCLKYVHSMIPLCIAVTGSCLLYLVTAMLSMLFYWLVTDISSDHKAQCWLATTNWLPLIISTVSPGEINNQMQDPPGWSTCVLINTVMFILLFFAVISDSNCCLSRECCKCPIVILWCLCMITIYSVMGGGGGGHNLMT